ETLVGRDPRAIEDIGEKLYRDGFWVGGPLQAAARSAIDIALWDVKGQHYGLPVYELLGGRSRAEIPLYCHRPCCPTPRPRLGRLSPANAIRLADALEPFKLLFIEEPIPPESAEELARVRARSRVPIAAGERLATIYEVRPFLALGAVDFLQCDPVACGGITG